MGSDGNSLISASSEGVVNVWKLDLKAIDIQLQLGGDKLEPFLNMLDPEEMGDISNIYREFEDYFYYAQIKR